MDDKGAIVEYEILDLDRHMDSSEMTPAGMSISAFSWRFIDLSLHAPSP